MNDQLFLDIAIYVTYALLGIAAFTAVMFPIIHFVQDFRKAKGTIIGLVALLAIVFIAFAFASNEPYAAQDVGSTTSKWISAGIITVFILIGVGIVSAIYTELSKLFTK
ncbi:MAG: hypothetical protein R6U11_10900 [Bacteroidales bacterium]